MKDWNWTLKESRHPVIERNLPVGEPYIANDILLDPASQQIIILTGPNMSGKVRYCAKQPSSPSCRIWEVCTRLCCKGAADDKIFTRVGRVITSAAGKVLLWWRWMKRPASSIILPAGVWFCSTRIGWGTSTTMVFQLPGALLNFIQQPCCAQNIIRHPLPRTEWTGEQTYLCKKTIMSPIRKWVTRSSSSANWSGGNTQFWYPCGTHGRYAAITHFQGQWNPVAAGRKPGEQ